MHQQAHHDVTVEVTLHDTDKLDESRGLLIPVPPATSHQEFLGLSLPPSWEKRALSETFSNQGAWLVTAMRDKADPPRLTYRFRLREGDVRQEHFRPFDNPWARPSEDLRRQAREVAAGAGSTRARIDSLVAFTARHFDYGPRSHFGEGDDAIPSLQCDLTTGNCVDINTFLLGALYAVDIPATYYAGYYFEAGAEPIADGMHCWIATLCDGQLLEWDIAHHLKRGLDPVAPALNPVPGTRVAVTFGRGLAYPIENLSPFGHLVQPHWIPPKGKASLASITARMGT